jgi:hypothetical protein
MKYIFIIFFFLLASCDAGSSQISLVEGDVDIRVSLSQSINSEGNDLSGDIINLDSNTIPILNIPEIVEPGYNTASFLKVENIGTVSIDFNLALILTEPLDGNIFWLTIRKINSSLISQVLLTTNFQSYDKDEEIVLPNYTLANTDDFHLFGFQLTINPNLDNTYNQNSTIQSFAFSLRISGFYPTANSSQSEL